MRRVCFIALLIVLMLGSAASADLIWFSSMSDGYHDISATVNYFSKSGYPSTASGVCYPESYTRGILHLALIIDGSARSTTDIYTELDLGGRIFPAYVSYSGLIHSDAALESYITPDVTTWRGPNPDFPEVYFSTGEAYVDDFSIVGAPEPSGMIALLTGIVGIVGILRRRTK